VTRLSRLFRRRPAPLDLQCREVVELLDDFLEGALSPEMIMALEHHLAGCDGCTTYLEQLRAAIALAATTGEKALPPALEQELLEAFRTGRS